MYPTDPPLLEHWLFEDPRPPALALVMIAALLLWVWRRRHQRVLGRLVLLCLVLAAGVVILARSVTTRREELAIRTEQLIAATSPLDMNMLRSMVRKRTLPTKSVNTPPVEYLVELRGPDGSPWLFGSAMLDQLERSLQSSRVTGQSIARLTAQSDDEQSGITSFVLITSFENLGERGVRTVWVLYWQRGESGQWELTAAQWMKFENATPNEGMWR